MSKGKFEYCYARGEELLRAYKRIISTTSDYPIRLPNVYRQVSESPCVRFWISEKRAYEVISDMIKGRSISHMSTNKQLMFYEIFRRVIVRQRNSNDNLKTIVEEIVQSPAPCFFMTPGTVKVLIHKHRKAKCKK